MEADRRPRIATIECAMTAGRAAIRWGQLVSWKLKRRGVALSSSSVRLQVLRHCLSDKVYARCVAQTAMTLEPTTLLCSTQPKPEMSKRYSFAPLFTQWLSQVSVSASSGAEMISWCERKLSCCVDAISPVLARRMEMRQRGVFSLKVSLSFPTKLVLTRNGGPVEGE